MTREKGGVLRYSPREEDILSKWSKLEDGETPIQGTEKVCLSKRKKTATSLSENAVGGGGGFFAKMTKGKDSKQGGGNPRINFGFLKSHIPRGPEAGGKDISGRGRVCPTSKLALSSTQERRDTRVRRD